MRPFGPMALFVTAAPCLVKPRCARRTRTGRLKTLPLGPINPEDMPLQPSRKRTQIVGAVSALAGMAFVPVVAGATPNTVDWARRALHVAARADAMAHKPIDSSRIKNGSIRGVDLAAGSVGTPQLKDGSVTAEKLAPGTLPLYAVLDGSVNGSKLADGAVGAAQLADGAVDSSKIADGAVDTSK